MSPNIDLHAHSTRSDGTLTPTALVQRARANGVDVLALTDHDILDGLAEALQAAGSLTSRDTSVSSARAGNDDLPTAPDDLPAAPDDLPAAAGATGGAPASAMPSRRLVLIPGVEISITWAGHTIHIVGLHIDPANSALQAGLAANRDGRSVRAREIAAGLERHGVSGAYEGALRFVNDPQNH